MRVRTKICGLCRAEDAAAAEAAGADLLGVILTAGFTRSRTHDEAGAIYAESGLPRVGVFVNEPADAVVSAARSLALSVVQLHGDETADDARALRSRLNAVGTTPELWKAARMAAAERVVEVVQEWSGVADAVLLDGYSPHSRGGSGSTFDWRAVAELLRGTPRTVRIVVAGGLTPENVTGAVRLLEPDVVDVSSGVEEDVGRKSRERMKAFVSAVAVSVAGAR